jgi:enediyne biosynthesis protein E4
MTSTNIARTLVTCLLVAALLFAAHAWAADPHDQSETTPVFTELFRGLEAIGHWADYDNDGDPDLFIHRQGSPNRLLRNEGTAFVEVAPLVGLADDGPAMDAAWADYDNDGDSDLYLSNGTGTDRLYRNNGDGSFTESAASLGVARGGNSRRPVWGDYDRDGDLDLYVNDNDANSLYRNDGQEGFAEVSHEVGLEDGPQTRGSASWVDYDGDGDIDLHVTRWDLPDRLYRNDGGHFVDVGSSVGIAHGGKGWASEWADYDNDGDQDLYLTNSVPPNKLFRNDGAMGFTDVSDALDATDGGGRAAWGDFDNDGDLDLYLAHGDRNDPQILQKALKFYRNDGAGGFTEISALLGAGLYGTSSGQMSWADYDADGDLDIFIPGGADTRLLTNSGNANRWLVLRLRGTVSNRDGIGALVQVVSGDLTQVREVNARTGHPGSLGFTLHFGMRGSTLASAINIRWPSGISQRLENVPANQVVTITEPDDGVDQWPAPAPDIGLSPSEILFGDVVVGESKLRNLVITNAGDAVLSVTSVEPMAVEVTVVPASLSIQPGAIDSVAVAYAPTAPGDLLGFLRVDSNDPNHPMLIVNLGGKALAAQEPPPGGDTPRAITETFPGGATAEFIQIDPGTFLMGSPLSESARDEDEGPLHQVTITRGFYLGKHEITQAQWTGVMGTRPWSGKESVVEDPDHPAVWTTWNDVQEFIEKLNHEAGWVKYRLPTEAEWEYACRAGTTTPWSFGSDEGLLKDYAWYRDSRGDESYAHRVGTKLPNPWGLHDMHGNVYEWVNDWKGTYPSDPQVDPTGPPSGLGRVARDGGHGSAARYVRSANRMQDSSQSPASSGLGFRLLRVSGTDTSATLPDPPSGRPGYALKFDGINDIVSFQKWFADPTPQYTMAAWVKINGPGTGEGYNSPRMIAVHRAHMSNTIAMTYRESGVLKHDNNTGDERDQKIETPDSFQYESWFHMSITFDGEWMRLYKDGKQIGEKHVPVEARQIDWETNYRGSLLGGEGGPWGGFAQVEVDEFSVWRVALGPTELQSSMSTSLTGDESGLLAYYTFEEGSGETVQDRSGHGRTGQLGTSSGSDDSDPVWVVSTAPLSGQVASAPDIDLSTTALPFGEIALGAFGDATLTVRNTGDATLSVSGILSSNGQWTVSSSSFDVVPGGSQDVTVVFTPSSAGTHTGTFSITSNDPDESAVTVSLSGTGIPAQTTATVRLSTTSLDFGSTDLREAISQRLTLENVSEGDVSVDGVFIEDEAQFALVGQLTLPFVIPPGLTKSLTFDFVPRFPGPQTSLLQVRISSPFPDILVASLSGTGVNDSGIPLVEISSITPASPARWDSAGSVVLLAQAFDGDEDGQSINRIAWLRDFSDTLTTAIAPRDYSLVLPLGQLEVGTHRLTLRVWDDEGDSSEDTRSYEVLGLQPLAAIDSAHVNGEWSRKVTLREGLDTFVLYGSDSDGDEFGESVASRSWTFGSESDHYSLRREVGSGQTLPIAPDRLGLGKHRVYYHVTDDEGVVSEPDSVQVIVRGRFGRAIIVAGGDLELRQRYSSRVANQVYDALVSKKRFDSEDVVYLNLLAGWEAWWKNVRVTDTDVSVERLRMEIEDARRDNVELYVPLLIFLAGHGGVSEFQLSEYETLHAEDLKAWIDELVQTKAAFRGVPVGDLPADEIVLVVDFCFSRTFLEIVSGPGRVVIGSSSDERALVIDGTSFSEVFFRWLSRGGEEANLWQSFEEASTQVQMLFPQSPYMDVDGDGISLVDERGNIIEGQEAGLDLAIGMFVGGELAGRALPLAEDPEIHTVTFSDMGLGRVAFEVKADPGLTGMSLSLVVLPESGPLPDADGEGTVCMAAAEPAAGDTVLYRGEVQFAQSGDYTVAILGTDDLGNFAGHVQVRLNVRTGPAADFDGDGIVGFEDFILFAQRYGTNEADPDWDATFDLDGSKAADFPDFLLLALSYGTSN